ncbi:MAG TPA: type II toxin-antitoxin system RelE/ParE family toxin [Blastocatellia bacterium]|nr:type II toxin-antitoxin system RelE/ParE family toxin [Blastocatellia bacterium]
MKIVWSLLALERAGDIADYIAETSVEAAKVWLIDIFGAVDRLQEFPESGRVVPEVNRPNIRELVFKNYRVIYRVERKQVSILTVRHGKQRLPLKEIK